jgi:hypothetical protein
MSTRIPMSMCVSPVSQPSAAACNARELRWLDAPAALGYKHATYRKAQSIYVLVTEGCDRRLPEASRCLALALWLVARLSSVAAGSLLMWIFL